MSIRRKEFPSSKRPVSSFSPSSWSREWLDHRNSLLAINTNINKNGFRHSSIVYYTMLPIQTSFLALSSIFRALEICSSLLTHPGLLLVSYILPWKIIFAAIWFAPLHHIFPFRKWLLYVSPLPHPSKLPIIFHVRYTSWI